MIPKARNIKMSTVSTKCHLAMRCLLACALLACFSDAYATANGDRSGAFSAASAISVASASSNAFVGTGNFPGIQDGHKEIRRYDNIGFTHDSNANRDAKSYGTPLGHGAGHDRSIKGADHDHGRNGDVCARCKWENDDYWERNEPEEEKNEDECDEGDDGQYRPDTTHHHGASGSGRGHESGSPPYQSGVHKQGPTGVYVDDGVNAGTQRGRPGDVNFPIGHAGSNSAFGGTTSKPETDWNTPFASKPGYNSAAAGTFGTTPSSWPSWNTGTTPGRPKPAWNSGPSVGSFVTTPRPGTNWNVGPGGESRGWNTGFDTPTTRFPSPQKPTSDWNTDDNKFNRNFGTPSIPGSNWNTGFSSSTIGLPSSQKPGIPWSGRDDGSFGTTPRSGQNWNTGFGGKPGLRNPDYGAAPGLRNPDYGAAPVSQSGCIQPDLSCNQGNIPIKVGATPVGPTKIGEYPNNVLPTTSGTGSDIFPGVTKPSYGTTSTYPWLTPGQVKGGSPNWHGPGSTNPQAGSSISNTRFPTTKTPFSYGSPTDSRLPGNPHVGTGSKQPGFNIASSSATANAGASAFATSFGTYNTPNAPGTSYDTTVAHGRDINYPGIKGSPESIRPSYGTNPYGMHPNAWPDKPDTALVPPRGSGTSPRYPSRYPETIGSTWPTGQSGISNEPRGENEKGRDITSGRYPGSDSRIWPAGRPGSVSGTTPGYFGIRNENRPTEQSASGTWPGRQSIHDNGSGCSSVTCGDSAGSVGGSKNCGSGNEGNYASATHGPCDGLTSGPSGVNKTYYPAGTGDGNVPNLGSAYGPNLSSNVGMGAYPGIGCRSGDNSCNQVKGANVIPDGSVQWNPANPFLFGTGGRTPSDVTRPWDSGITVKPLGKGNPFLDSSWSTPKPGYNTNDQNVIPLGRGSNKPIGQGNPFLDNSEKRGDVDINANKGVIPLGERKPEENNPLLRPGSGSNAPSYGRQSSGFPESGIPKGENPQDTLQCKLGIFGCGTPGSGSYAPTKGSRYPGGSFGGENTGVGDRSPESVTNVPGGSANPGAGIGSSPASGYPGNVAGAHAGAYAGSFSNAQASSFAGAKSLSSSKMAETGDNFGQTYDGSGSSSGAQNPGRSNSWASSGASAFASSSSGSWSEIIPPT